MHILLLLLVVFVLLVILTRSRRRVTRYCRWQEDPSGDRGTLRKYQCETCGAEAFTSTPGPPETCRDPDRSR